MKTWNKFLQASLGLLFLIVFVGGAHGQAASVAGHARVTTYYRQDFASAWVDLSQPIPGYVVTKLTGTAASITGAFIPNAGAGILPMPQCKPNFGDLFHHSFRFPV
jgi:hypothetical protein